MSHPTLRATKYVRDGAFLRLRPALAAARRAAAIVIDPPVELWPGSRVFERYLRAWFEGGRLVISKD